MLFYGICIYVRAYGLSRNGPDLNFNTSPFTSGRSLIVVSSPVSASVYNMFSRNFTVLNRNAVPPGIPLTYAQDDWYCLASSWQRNAASSFLVGFELPLVLPVSAFVTMSDASVPFSGLALPFPEDETFALVTVAAVHRQWS